MAPNTLTLIGLILNLVFYAAMVYYDKSLCMPIPTWTIYGFTFALFAYQTLDAIDGKQARRTGSSSPLGQLFDHGCDAMGAVFVGLAMCQAAQLCHGLLSYAFLCAILVPFFAA